MSDVIAALFVQTNGSYYGLPGVDPWDEKRDARLYDGPHPVVAHPPCARWCRLAGFCESRYGLKRRDDGGCFASALASVRRWGGVLEHPAYSAAWRTYGINNPPAWGGWGAADFQGGWTCYVEQGRYGHPAKKATWLYANGAELPSLRWGKVSDASAGAVSWCGNGYDSRPRLRKSERIGTPTEFRDVLLDMARSVTRRAA